MVDFKKKTLSSGLNLVTAPMATESVTVLGMVRTGSSDEKSNQHGGAHFLEHMVFKGTKKYPGVGDVSRAVEDVGGIQNAFTGTEYTAFWVKVPAGARDLAVKVVGQMMNEPLMDEKEFKKEKGTIIEEIRMYEDLYPRVAGEKFNSLVFKGTNLERPILGTMESIKKMEVGDLKTFHDRWYWKNNMAIVVVGKLGDEQKLAEKIEEEFRTVIAKGNWEDKRKKEKGTPMKDVRVLVTKKKSEQVNLRMGVNWFETCSKKRYAAKVMNRVLGRGMSSRLWKEIREKRGLAYIIHSGVFLGKDQGLFYAGGGIRKGKEEEVVKIIKEEIYRLGEEMVSEEELIRAKEVLKGSMKIGLETSNGVANVLAWDWALRMGKIRSFKEKEKSIEGVTKKEIMEVAKNMLEGNKWCLSLVGSFDEKKKEEELKKILKS